MSRTRRNRKGAAILEFTFAGLLLVPVMVGTFALGMGATRYLQVSSVCRSTGSMFVRGADFSQPTMKRVLVKIGGGIGLGTGDTINTSGRVVVTVTQLMRIGSAQCAALPPSTPCTNLGRVVITKQLRLGNDSLRASAFGTPDRSQASSDGSFPATYYLTNNRAAVGFFNLAPGDNQPTPGAPLDLRAGEVSYAAEVFMEASDLNIAPILQLSGFYSRYYF